MAKQDDSLNVVLTEIRKEQGKLKKATGKHTRIGAEESAFYQHFSDNQGRYLVYGLICLTVMAFDFIVNGKTMVWLARMLQTLPAVIALILTLVDGFLAIMASGIFDAADMIMLRRSRKKWSAILWSIAAVKMIAYVTYVVMRSQIVNAESGAVLSVDYTKVFLMALPQLVFIVVIYSLLHLCGAGLWFFMGRFWFKLQRLFAPNPDDIRQRLHGLVGECRKHCERNGIDYEQVKAKHQHELEGYVV